MAKADSFTAEIIKEFGENTIVSAESFLERPIKIISVSPAFDLGLGGGIPLGTWTNIIAWEKVGKTTTALHIAKKFQQLVPTGIVYYANIEGRLKRMNLVGTPGLDLTRFKVIESSEEQILSAQNYLDILNKLLLGSTEILVILDSYSMLSHAKEQEEGVGTSTRGAGGYTLLSQFTRVICNILPVKRNTVIAIGQFMSNPSGYGSPVQEKGGNSVKYANDVKLICREKKVEEWKSDEKRIGQTVNWLVETSALGSPFTEIKSYIRYGQGIDEEYELMKLAVDLGIVSKTDKGGWHTYGEKKIQGEDNFYKYLKEEPKVFSEIKSKINEMLGL